MNIKSRDIALVGPFPPMRGGISLFNSQFRQAFGKKGYSVLSVGFKRQYPGFLFPGSSELMPEKINLQKLRAGQGKSGHVESGNVESGHVESRHMESNQIIDTCNPLTWLEAVKFILKSGVDCAIISWWHPWFMPSYGFIADRLKKSGVRVCFLCHNFRHHGRSAVYWDFFMRRMLSGSDSVIFLSSAVASTAKESFLRPFSQKNFQKKFKFFPDFIQRFSAGFCKDDVPPFITLFHPVYKTDNIKKVQIPEKWTKKILMAGYVREYKGIEYGLGLLAGDKEISLTIAGEFYDNQLLSRVMKTQRLFGSRLVVIPEYLKDFDLVKIIDNHDILICPYTLSSQSGVVALAQGRATPAAVFPAGGLIEQVSERTGIVCDDMSLTSLKKAIDKIYLKTPGEWAYNIRKDQLQKSWELFAEKVQIGLMTVI